MDPIDRSASSFVLIKSQKNLVNSRINRRKEL